MQPANPVIALIKKDELKSSQYHLGARGFFGLIFLIATTTIIGCNDSKTQDASVENTEQAVADSTLSDTPNQNSTTEASQSDSSDAEISNSGNTSSATTASQNGSAVSQDNQTSATSNSLSAKGSSLSATGSSLSATQNDFVIELNLSSDVLFDFGKSELKPEADSSLQKVADLINQKGNGSTTIIGHTDSVGNDNDNMKLSLARANAVKKWLASHGVTQNILVEGKGESEPIAPNTHPDGSDNPEGRAKNRRVDIMVNSKTTLADVNN